MNSWSITASLLIESRDQIRIGNQALTVRMFRLNMPARSGLSPFSQRSAQRPMRAVPTFLSLGGSGSAIFFTTLSGTCSKCVLDFRVALFDLAIDEQYRDPRYTGDLFWKPVAWLALAKRARLAVPALTYSMWVAPQAAALLNESDVYWRGSVEEDTIAWRQFKVISVGNRVRMGPCSKK